MTISTLGSRADYLGDGASVTFPVPFQFFAPGDLLVQTLRIATGAVGVLALGPGYAVSGGGGAPGAITLTAPLPVGDALTIQRQTARLQNTDYVDYDPFPAESHEAALDRLTMQTQELAALTERSIRVSSADQATGMTIPPAVARANRVLGFDAAGALTVYDLSNGSLAPVTPEGGSTELTAAVLFGEPVDARAFGAAGNGIADDTAALNAAFAYAAFTGRMAWVPAGDYRTSAPVVLGGGARGLRMDGEIVAAGGFAALVCGDGGALANQGRAWGPLRVRRLAQSDWSDWADIGIVLRNADACQIEVAPAEGFTIGVRTLGEQRGFEDTTIVLGRIANNRVGLDIRTGDAGAWNNSIRYIGGHFGIGAGVNPAVERYGVRFSAEGGAYLLHNSHVFEGPNFELARTGAVAAIPFLSEVNSRAVIVRGMRMEACDAFAARHTAGAQDHLYEVAYASPWGYGVDIDYTATATRVGSVVQTLHQSAAHTRFTHLLANTPSVRAAAFRWTATQTGFDGLACISTSPSGPPTTLAGNAFPGLDNFTMSTASVSVAAQRGLAYAVHTANCRDFALAADATAMRLFVQCFDASGDIITSGDMVRLSSGSCSYNATSRWWQAAADLSDGSLTRLTAIRLHGDVKFALIGVFANGSGASIRSMRLLCPPEFSPAVVNGTPFCPAGRDWIEVDHAFDPPSIAAGDDAIENVSLPGARAGDFCSVTWSAATTGGVFSAQIGATDTVTIVLRNRTNASLDLVAGTARIRVRKQRA